MVNASEVLIQSLVYWVFGLSHIMFPTPFTFDAIDQVGVLACYLLFGVVCLSIEVTNNLFLRCPNKANICIWGCHMLFLVSGWSQSTVGVRSP